MIEAVPSPPACTHPARRDLAHSIPTDRAEPAYSHTFRSRILDVASCSSKLPGVLYVHSVCR